MRPLPLLLCAALASSAAGAGQSAQTAQRVVFQDGRSLLAERAVSEEGFTTLTLLEGGVLVVPDARIAAVEVEEIEAAPELVQTLAEALGRGDRWRALAGDWAVAIEAAAGRHGLDPVLLASMVQVESNFHPRAVSPKGARGLLQLMPATARRFGVDDPFDPHQNLEGGAQYFRWLLDRFDGRTDLALAAYNAGEGAVDRHGRRIPPYGETLRYVNRILERAIEAGQEEASPR
jgi:soluble lytic murein transglycosylase-like protein